VISNIGTTNAAGLAGQLLRPEKPGPALPNELNSVGVIGSSDAPLRINTAQPSDASQPASFSNLIERAVQEVDGKMKAAGAEQSKVLTGETNNLHQAMISMQEASLAFSLMVEVRNKLVDSYQELMRMQV